MGIEGQFHGVEAQPDRISGEIWPVHPSWLAPEKGVPLMEEYSCMVELTEEDTEVEEVMVLIGLPEKAEIIMTICGFVDGIVFLTGGNSNFFSAISIFKCKAVSLWISRDDSLSFFQN